MKPADHLVVFAKEARVGRVKSRLAADIGRVPAWAFARRNTGRVLRRLAGRGRWRAWLAVTPDSAAARPVWPPGWVVIGQGPGDLGARMARAMESLPPGPVVIVGTDVPGVRRRHIEQAFRLLGSHDAVFGPAADGGYWLVGLRRRPRVPHLFAGVRWSTAHALADTRANLPAGARVALLDELEDVDDAAALARATSRG